MKIQQLLVGRKQILNLVIVCVVSVTFVLAGGRALQAVRGSAETLEQQGPEVEVSIRGNQAAALQALHKQTSLNLIADGGENEAVYTVSARGSARKALEAAAEQLDFSVSQSSQGIALLSRRFTRDEEYPQANLGELRQTARDMLAGFRALDPSPDNGRIMALVESNPMRSPEGLAADQMWGATLKTLARSLTQEQIAQLAGGTVLTRSALAPAQRQMLVSAVISRALDADRIAWEILAARLRGIQSAVLGAYPMQSADPNTVRYLCQFGTRGSRTPPAFLGEFTTPAPEEERGEKAAGPEQASPDGSKELPKEPAKARTKEWSSTPVTLLLGLTTLQPAMAELSRQCGATLEVDPSLSDRRMIVLLEAVPARDVLDAIAAMYRWHWAEKSAGAVYLSRATIPLPKRPAEMAPYLRAVLPSDFAAFFHLQPLTGPGQRAVQPTASGPMGMRASRGIMSGLAPLKKAVIRHKTLGIELPYSKLSPLEQERARFLLILLAFQNADDTLWNGAPGPASAENLDAGLEMSGEVLMVQLRNDKENFHFGFGKNVVR